jgi:hypothetical protein
MTFYYAQINADNVCFAITQTAGLVTQPDMIRIDSYNLDLLGKAWSGGDWVEPEPAAA